LGKSHRQPIGSPQIEGDIKFPQCPTDRDFRYSKPKWPRHRRTFDFSGTRWTPSGQNRTRREAIIPAGCYGLSMRFIA
jgi:hypothetical protein